jgi:hypothetical protein
MVMGQKPKVYQTMSDFWNNRGLVSPGSDEEPPPAPVSYAEAPADPLPGDYAARLCALEKAVQLTMSKFDGGLERVMDRARAFHAFLTGRRPSEFTLPLEAYEAAEAALKNLDAINQQPLSELAEASVDAAWEVIINQGRSI